MAFPISIGSGATLATNLIDGEHRQLIAPVTVNPIPAGSFFIGLISAASIHGKVDIATALPAGANFVGLATTVIGNTPAVSQSGTWNVGVTGLISLASGTLIGLNAGNNNIGDVDVASLPALPAGANFIGLATVILGSNPAVTQSGNWNITSLASGAHINTYRQNATPAGANFIGLATTVMGNTPLVSLPSGFGPMIPISTYTSLATVISAAGNATLFVPPSGQRWVMKDLSITALGRGEVQIKSGANVLIPSMALATTSGYAKHYGDSGLPAKAADESFVVNILSAATLGIQAVVRFL